jgi:hypothetical protein
MSEEIDLLFSLLKYDKINNTFYWVKRPKELFTGQCRCNSWNTKYAGKIISGKKKISGYPCVRVLGKTYMLHRLVFLFEHQRWPSTHIDHINGDREDYRVENLREATPEINSLNRGINKNNSSGVSGVYWDSGESKWRVQININKKLTPLGRFSNLEEAIKIRKDAETLYNYHPNHGKVRVSY